jgi:hypothetical protein
MPPFKRALALAALAVGLAGCESYGDLTSDAFEPGNVPQTRFDLDAANCAASAEYPRQYDLAGIHGSDAARHRIFNRAYTECMAKLGYARRGWSVKYPAPYTFDLRP